MMGRFNSGGSIPRKVNVVVYDANSGKITQTANMRFHRVNDFFFGQNFLFLITPEYVTSNKQMVVGAGLVDRPTITPLTLSGNVLTLPVLPDGTKITIENEVGDQMEITYPTAETGLTFTDVGEYRIEIENAFPFQNLVQEIEISA